MSVPVRVLVVDDSALMRKVIKGILVDAGLSVTTARTGAEALETVSADPPDVVTLDVTMPGMDGITCLARLMVQGPLPVVILSSLTDADADAALEALALGAVDVVRKPAGEVTPDLEAIRVDLVARVRAAAGARVRRSAGLRERLRHQREVGAHPPVPIPTQGDVRRRDRRPADRPGRRVRSAAVLATNPALLSWMPADDDRPAPEIVLIGASTGGPAALGVVLAQLPADFRSAVVIAQHIPASFTRHLADRLDRTCALPVIEVAGIQPVHPGRVYLGRGDADVVLARRGPGELVVRSVPASPAHRWHPSMDRLTASALRWIDPPRTVGVLLTGMGDDGAEQLTILHGRGGRTVAESDLTAVVHGMPGELIRRGGARTVVPLEVVGKLLAAWGRPCGPEQQHHFAQ